jgi:hypothetical protein
MDLIDLIGDSRTDSLPPGFLRSIKIKYRQEASHVFPNKPKTAQEAADRVGSAMSAKSIPVRPKNPSNIITWKKLRFKELFPTETQEMMAKKAYIVLFTL